MSNKKFWLAVVVFSFIWGYFMVSAVFAGGVTDNNNGNQGNIFISTGENNGANSVGTWVNASDVPELKGAKGDKGDKGDTGAKGDTGSQGIQGNTGAVGETGQNGMDGVNGQDGKDVDPNTLNQFKDHINDNSAKIDDLDNRVNKLEDTQYYVQGSVRVVDTKKWEVQAPVVSYSFTRNKTDRVGVEFMYKFGQSYEETLIEKMQAQIDTIESYVSQTEQANLDYANQNYNITETETGVIITEKE